MVYKTLAILIIGLSISAANFSLQLYGDYYFDNIEAGVNAEIIMTLVSFWVLWVSVKHPEKWKVLIPFWIVISLLGVFCPTPREVGVLVYPVLGIAPLFLISIFWTVALRSKDHVKNSQ